LSEMRRAARYLVTEKLIEIATEASESNALALQIIADVERLFNGEVSFDVVRQEFLTTAKRMKQRLLPTNWEQMKDVGRTRNVDRDMTEAVGGNMNAKSAGG